MNKLFSIVALLFFFGLRFGFAENGEEPNQEAHQIEGSLQWKQGNIPLGDNLATLKVIPEFRYLAPTDAKKIIVDLWRNPPNNAQGILGMIFPSDVNPTDETSWGVVITYNADGFVKDDDAAKINYKDVLDKLQKTTQDANAERTKQGYEPISILGWATQPHYDRTSHKFYWAKELQFGTSQNHTLNYDIRVLGRKGVLVLRAVASMADFQQIEARMPQVISMVEFNSGNRYADFTPGTDKVAEYGLAALVLGGVAAKVGLFKGLIALLLAGKKFIILAVVAVGGFFTKMFRRKKRNDQA
jgi:uncharacterized membrane-anchored protein